MTYPLFRAAPDRPLALSIVGRKHHARDTYFPMAEVGGGTRKTFEVTRAATKFWRIPRRLDEFSDGFCHLVALRGMLTGRRQPKRGVFCLRSAILLDFQTTFDKAFDLHDEFDRYADTLGSPADQLSPQTGR